MNNIFVWVLKNVNITMSCGKCLVSELYTQFRELIKGKTSMLISHRFSSVRMADIIAVLEGGKIVEYGSHDELLFKSGKYAYLFNLQAERYS